MKFYDKKYFELSQSNIYFDNFETIPDKKYSKKDIDDLYNKRLKLEMEEEKRIYNTKPDFKSVEEELNSGDINFEDYIYTDEDGKIHIPTSKKQILNHLAEEKKEALKSFNERPEFDEDNFREEFKESFEFVLDEISNENFPEWVFEKVDKRIIALNYLPESVWEELKKEEIEIENKLQAIREEARLVLDAQGIPLKISNRFKDFYDAMLRNFKENKDDYEMRLITEIDELVILKFKSAKIIENEKMDFRKNAVYYVGEELYKNDDNYEVHMIFNEYSKKGNEFKYITLSCSDIKISKSE